MKLEYYKYMVQIGLQDEAYLDVSKHFMAIMKTPRIQEDEPKQLEVHGVYGYKIDPFLDIKMCCFVSTPFTIRQ